MGLKRALLYLLNWWKFKGLSSCRSCVWVFDRVYVVACFGTPDLIQTNGNIFYPLLCCLGDIVHNKFATHRKMKCNIDSTATAAGSWLFFLPPNCNCITYFYIATHALSNRCFSAKIYNVGILVPTICVYIESESRKVEKGVSYQVDLHQSPPYCKKGQIEGLLHPLI